MDKNIAHCIAKLLSGKLDDALAPLRDLPTLLLSTTRSS
jgi:hypothetical protein